MIFAVDFVILVIASVCCLNLEVNVTSENTINFGVPLIFHDVNILEKLIDLMGKIHKVGEVIQSVLPPEQFSNLHGDGWVLLDGSQLNKTSKLYELTNMEKLPNSTRRFFIMGQRTSPMNSTEYVNQSTAQPVKYGGLGKYNDIHTHLVDGSCSVSVTGGSHSHSYDLISTSCCVVQSGDGSNNTVVTTAVDSLSETHGHDNSDFGGHTGTYNYTHDHEIIGWDKFTRPRSIVVNSYIRIN